MSDRSRTTILETRETLLERLNETISRLFSVYRNITDPEMAVDEGWTAKDILAHITFWHESFARNVNDLANGVKPTPLKGKLIDLNQRGVDDMKMCSLHDVVQRLEAAHSTIQQNILNPQITLIPYRKGSRDYTPEEHLDIVNKHVNGHLRGVTEAYHKTQQRSLQ